MNASLVELGQQIKEIVQIQLVRSFPFPFRHGNNLMEYFGNARAPHVVIIVAVVRHRHGFVRSHVLLQHLDDCLGRQNRSQRLVLSVEEQPHHAVPLREVDRRRRVPQLDAHNSTLHLGRRTKVVPRHLHELVHPRQQLRVDRESAVERLAGTGRETKRELLLKHHDGAPKGGSVREQFEDEAGGDLVGHIGDAHVEEGQGGFENVALHDLELVASGRVLHTLKDLTNHARVVLDGDDLAALLRERNGHVTSTGSHLQHDVRRFESCLSDDGRDHGRIFEKVLSETGVGSDEIDSAAGSGE